MSFLSAGDFISRDRPQFGRRDGLEHDYSQCRTRTGVVVQLDNPNVRVLVQFLDHDQIISYWLLVVQAKTHADKGFWMPDVGDQVLCLMDQHDEQGFVLGMVYSTVDMSPGWGAPSALKRTSDHANSPSSTPLTGSLDSMFMQAAATCSGINSYGNPTGQGWKLLKALAVTESSLNTNAVSEPGADGSRCYGIMQISPTAHPGYTPDQLKSDTELNIRLGTADLCGKLANYGDMNDALAHYKGYQGYADPAYGGHAKIRVDQVISEYGTLGGT